MTECIFGIVWGVKTTVLHGCCKVRLRLNSIGLLGVPEADAISGLPMRTLKEYTGAGIVPSVSSVRSVVYTVRSIVFVAGAFAGNKNLLDATAFICVTTD